MLSILLLGLCRSNSVNIILAEDKSLEHSFQEIRSTTNIPLKEWTATQVISTESTDLSDEATISVDSEGNIEIIWTDSTDYLGSSTDCDIFHKSFDVHSQEWIATDVISTESTLDSCNASHEQDAEGNIHVVWFDYTEYGGSGTDYDIFYKCWNATLETWGTTQVVSTESTVSSDYPDIAVDKKGNVHVVWHDRTDYAGAGTDWDVFYRCWNATLGTWGTTQVVSTESTENAYYPDIAVDKKGKVHVVWHDLTDCLGAGTDYDVFYKSLDPKEGIWTALELISSQSSRASARTDIIAGYDNSIHVVWHDSTDYYGAGTDWDIFYRLWDADDQEWETTQVVSTMSTEDSMNPEIAVDRNYNVYFTWEDHTDYLGCGVDWDIFYRTYNTAQKVWTIVEVLSVATNVISCHQSIAVDNIGNVYVVWTDATNLGSDGADRDIFFRQLIGTPPAAELAFINPNPNLTGDVHLDWNTLSSTIQYTIYRSSSYIWSIDELVPIDSVNESYYYDTIIADDYYYYVITATNMMGTSAFSNCEYVEVWINAPAPPELAIITPNPSSDSNIVLDWDDVDGAISYFVYRSDSFIWSIGGLTPIATVGTSTHSDSLPSTGYYFYAIVATDGLRNSKMSNCEYVHYVLPTLGEIIISSSVAMVILVAILVLRKRKKWKQE